MIWWLLCVFIMGVLLIAQARFVPERTLRNYAEGSKGAVYWIALVFYYGIFIVSGINCLIAPTDLPIGLRVFGAVLMIIGGGLQIAAMRANPSWLPVIVRPRFHVTGGVYRLKHPGYIGLGMNATGGFLLLAQDPAIIPLGCYLGLLIGRSVIENRFFSTMLAISCLSMSIHGQIVTVNCPKGAEAATSVSGDGAGVSVQCKRVADPPMPPSLGKSWPSATSDEFDALIVCDGRNAGRPFGKTRDGKVRFAHSGAEPIQSIGPDQTSFEPWSVFQYQQTPD